MAPQQKRAAPQAVAAVAPEAKRKAATFLKQQGLSAGTMKAATEVLEHPLAAEGIPEACRQMLAGMLPFALCVPSDRRDEHQTLCVEMAREVLDYIQAKMQEAINSEEGHIAAADAQKELLQVKFEAAESMHTAAAAAVTRCKDALAEVTRDMNANQHALKARQVEQQAAGSAHEQRKVEHADLEGVLAGCFASVKKGSGSAEDCLKMGSVAKKLGLDESLLSALPTALAKQFAERGSFDNMVFDQLTEKLHCTIAALGAQIESEAPMVASRAQALAGASAEVATAEAAKQGAAEQLRSASEAEADAKRPAAVAKEELSAQVTGRCAKAAEAKREREGELAAFRAGSCSAFGELRDRISAAKDSAAAPEQAKDSETTAGGA